MKVIVDIVQDIAPDRDLSDVAVVFPAYNEERRVQEAIEKALAVGVGRVVCVNDCSTDRTPDILRSYTGYPKVDIVHHPVNLGKQAAVKHGLQRALLDGTMRRFGTLDADMQNDPAMLARVAAPVGDYDIVMTCRSREEMPPARRAANTLANLPYRVLARVDIHDIQTGYRVYTREVTEYLAGHLTDSGRYTLEHTTMELFGEMAVRRGRPVRIAEVPIAYEYKGSVSHIRIRDKIQLTCASVRYAWRLAKLLRG